MDRTLPIEHVARDAVAGHLPLVHDALGGAGRPRQYVAPMYANLCRVMRMREAELVCGALRLLAAIRIGPFLSAMATKPMQTAVEQAPLAEAHAPSGHSHPVREIHMLSKLVMERAGQGRAH